MWTALLTEGPTAPAVVEAAGSPVALMITAVCGGLAALITAVSLLLRARRSDAPEQTGGVRPMGERVAVVEQELDDLREEFEELRDLLTSRRPNRTVPTPRRSLTP